MSTIPVAFSYGTRVSTYPQISGNDAGMNLKDRYHVNDDVDFNILINALPEINSDFPSADFANGNKLVFIDYNLQRDPCGWWFVDLVYGNPAKGGSRLSMGGAKQEGLPEFWKQASRQDLPLEDHPEYRKKWNNALYQSLTSFEEFGAVVPTWWADAEKDFEVPSEFKNIYVFSGDSLDGAIWVKIKEKTKPGIESFIGAGVIINERRYFKEKGSAGNYSCNVGQRQTPEETLGTTGLKWLVTDASLSSDGEWFVVEKSYLGASYIDSEIYPES